MAYIPKYNRLSLQELSYAPTLMRQQHDEAVANEMALAEAMKFDYLNQDAQTLEPQLQQYNQNIDELSSELATRGFSHDLKNRLVGLQKQYTSDDKIRNIKKNYANAMSGWEETKKSLIQKGASGDAINNMRKAYFGDYKGAYDDEGFYRPFEAGATSGIYDIAEDTKKAMTNLGKTGKVVGNSGASIESVPADPVTGTPAHYRIYNSKIGQYITTGDQIEATKAYMKAEYDPENKMSDRGLYSRIMGYDQNYLNNLIDNVGTSMTDQYYQQLPQNDVDIRVPSGGPDKPPTSPVVLPVHQQLVTNDSKYKEAQKDEEILTTGVGTTKKSTGMRSTPTGQQIAYETVEDPIARQKYDNVVKKYKENYPSLYATMDDSTATSVGIQFEKDLSAFKYSYIPLKSPDATENVYNSIVDFTGKGALLDEDGDKVQYSKIAESYKETGLDWKSVPPIVDYKGDIHVRDAEGNMYKVDPNSLDKTTQSIQTLTKKTFNQLSNPRLFDDDGNNLIGSGEGNKPFAYTPNGKAMYLHVLQGNDSGNPVEKYDLNNRYIEIVSRNTNGTYNREQLLQPGELFQTLAEGMRSGFQFYKK